MNAALQCSECGRAIHSTALSGVCTFCLVNTTRTNLSSDPDLPAGKSLWPGRTVGPQDRFMLLKKIGQGGMGEIWLANDEHLSNGREARPVALKFICEEIRTNRRAMALLRDEVARTQTLNHPNIVRIHDMHATMDGTPFIKMEFVEGDSLAQWLRSSGEPLPWRLVCDLGAQVALALDYAHRAGNLVHRDVKPGNILVGHGPGGLCAKLTDFGIAQALQDPEFEAGGEPTGTMAYASPEQIQGRPPAPSDDAYALGATLFELLTGSLPNEGATTEALRAQAIYSVPENINARLQRLGAGERVPSDLANLVAQCLSKEAAARPTMKRIAALLGQLRGIGSEEEEKPEKKSWWKPAALAACLGVAAYAVHQLDLVKTIRAKAGPRGEVPVPAEAPAEKPDEGLDPVEQTPAAAQGANPIMARVASAEPGWIAVTLSSQQNVRRTVSVWHKNQLLREEVLPRQALHRFFHESREPGLYKIVVAQEGYRSNAERELMLEPGKTNAALIFFGTKEVALRSEPGSRAAWVPETFGRSSEANGTTRRFETEVPYTFTFSQTGFQPFITNVTFSGLTPGVLDVKLAPKTAPEFGRNAPEFWTNSSMGMVFRLVGHLRVCTTETTVAQFRRFADAAGASATNGMFSMTSTGRRQAGYSWRNPGFQQTDVHPVVGVSELDAQAFCAWLTQADEGLLEKGQTYRLPTVEEWRTFSGAGRFPWGDNSKIEGNFSGVEVLTMPGEFRWPASFPLLDGYEDAWPRTAPVTTPGQGARSGLTFVAGNAAEWCQGGKVCGGSWFDGETVDFYEPLNTLLTEDLIQTFHSAERDDRLGFRVVIAEGSGVR